MEKILIIRCLVSYHYVALGSKYFSEIIADVSQRLLTKLEEALNGKDFDHQVLGELCLYNIRIEIVRYLMYHRDFSPS